jgi:hypothetical protein
MMIRNWKWLEDLYNKGEAFCDGELDDYWEDLDKAREKIQKYREELLKNLSPERRREYRTKLDKNTALVKVDIFLRDALRPENRKGKYRTLSRREIKALAAALLSRYRSLMRTISTTEDFLRLAYDQFHSPLAGYKRVGKGIASKREFFEKMNLRRGVIAGHGAYHPEVPPIMVPKGKTIHFYCKLGDTVKDTYAQTVEGYTATGALPEPHESWGEGTKVENHFLGFPAGLNLNLVGRGKYNVITVKDRFRWVPLSILLKDPLCKVSTDIHWVACREKIGSSYKLRGSYMYSVFGKGPSKKFPYG